MSIQPDYHATGTGSATRLLANRRHAWTSIGSKSGNSSTICSALSPFASRSSTSLTRILMPRMHGRPPHCSGSSVIRSTRVATVDSCRFWFDAGLQAQNHDSESVFPELASDNSIVWSQDDREPLAIHRRTWEGRAIRAELIHEDIRFVPLPIHWFPEHLDEEFAAVAGTEHGFAGSLVRPRSLRLLQS